jgi:hypothetical protein
MLVRKSARLSARCGIDQPVKQPAAQAGGPQLATSRFAGGQVKQLVGEREGKVNGRCLPAIPVPDRLKAAS